MSYNVELSKQAIKNLKSIPQNYVRNIYNHLKELEQNPHPKGSIKMAGSENTYRLRVGVYRIVYDVFEKELIIKVITIDHRKDVYK